MRDQAAAERLLAQGYRAIQVKPFDFEALKAAVRQLIALLPADEREAAEARGGFGGTIIGTMTQRKSLWRYRNGSMKP